MSQPSNSQPTNIKESVQSQFNQAAQHYSASKIHAAGPDLAVMLQLAAPTATASILDAGCGTGHTALYFAPHVPQVIALDLSTAMLDQGRQLAAQRGITNIDFRQGDVEHLPFADESFDLVLSRYSAHHWPHPLAALTEFRRVLRPNGQLLLGDIVSWDDFTLDTHFQAIEILRDASHVRDHTIPQWVAMLQRAGFAADVAHTWEVYIDFASWVQRMLTPAPKVAMIRAILADAPQSVQQAFQLQPDGSFTMQAAILRGRPLA
jgi:ubiquinone/menaquinone biosynthesis C-methylase UbiE